MTKEELINEQTRLYAWKMKINTRLKTIGEQLQELCDHKWEWAQVAGEGKFCVKCGKVDYSDD